MQKIIKLSEFLNSFSLPPRVKQTVQPPKENSMGSGAWICNDARESGTCWCHHRVPSASTALSRQPGGPAWPAHTARPAACPPATAALLGLPAPCLPAWGPALQDFVQALLSLQLCLSPQVFVTSQAQNFFFNLF